MFINRFPKMTALQKFRALTLGYEEELAKAIGIAEATKYAIFKNLSYNRRKEQEIEALKKKKIPPQKLDETTFATFKLQALEGLPFVGHRTYTALDYDRAIFGRWGEEVGSKIEAWAKAIVDSCDLDILQSERKFFEECWKPHRDEDPLKISEVS